MSENRLRWISRGFADDASQSDGPPDLGPLRALAEREEFAEATERLADAYGRSLRDDDPLRPLAHDIARALTEAGFSLHHCGQHDPLYRLGGVCLLPVTRGHDPDGRGGVVVSYFTIRFRQPFRSQVLGIRIGRSKIRRNVHLNLDRARSARHNQNRGEPESGGGQAERYRAALR